MIEYKFLSPLYVPIQKLDGYMKMDKSTLEIQILKSIYETSPGNFTFIDESDLREQLKLYPNLNQILVGNKHIGKKKRN